MSERQEPSLGFKIRPATAADQQAIKTLIRAVRINPLGLEWQHFLVAVDATGNLIGCGQVKPHRDGSRELASIAVVRAWRKQGVARAIIEQLMSQHAPPLWLTCTSNLIPFYEQFGFVEVTETAGLPPYFRRLRRLSHIFLRFARRQEYLAVMRWSA